MPTTKKQALNVIKKMSDKATWDDIMYEIYVRKKIAAGIKESDARPTESSPDLLGLSRDRRDLVAGHP